MSDNPYYQQALGYIQQGQQNQAGAFGDNVGVGTSLARFLLGKQQQQQGNAQLAQAMQNSNGQIGQLQGQAAGITGSTSPSMAQIGSALGGAYGSAQGAGMNGASPSTTNTITAPAASSGGGSGSGMGAMLGGMMGGSGGGGMGGMMGGMGGGSQNSGPPTLPQLPNQTPTVPQAHAPSTLPGGYQNGQTATNRTTGQRLVYQNGSWGAM